MIVNTHISDNDVIPAYVEISLRQARFFNPDREIYFICKAKQSYFDSLNVNWVPQESISGDALRRFNEVSWFKRHGTPSTTFPSEPLFWHRTCERLFYLYEFIKQNACDTTYHFENDVLIFDSLDKLAQHHLGNWAIPMSPNHATFAFTLINDPERFGDMCDTFIRLMEKGEDYIKSLGYDHVSEMSLLDYVIKEGLVLPLPSMPSTSEKFVFDPGSYGQYVGGTNGGDGPNFIDPTHYVGQMLNGDRFAGIDLYMQPRVFNILGTRKLFNLHVHSKNLAKFAVV